MTMKGSELIQCMIGHDRGTVAIMLDVGVPTDIDKAGATVLILAAMFSNTKFVCLLLQKGAELNKKCERRGRTALQFAIFLIFQQLKQLKSLKCF